jgi:hypothetical protein
MNQSLSITVCFVVLNATVAFAFEPSPPDDLSTQTAALDAQTQAMKADLEKLNQSASPTRLPAVDATPTALAGPPPANNRTVPGANGHLTPEMQAEMKKLGWKKGDFTIVPYGWLWANTAYETERSNQGDYTLYVFSAQDQGEHAYHVDARSTRLGMDVLGPTIPCLDCAPSGGRVEIDFQGQFLQENKPGVLLRHAYWEVKNERFRILAGQTWDIISPLNPDSTMYSVFWDAGNIGYRRAQFRGERYVAFSDWTLLTFQGSINSDIFSDFSTSNPALFTGEDSSWPTLQGRMAVTLGDRGVGCQPVTLGVSAHIGNQEFDFAGTNPAHNLVFRTWSCNVDLKAPITDRFGAKGELFCGENLGAYLGGIGQGIDPFLRQAIDSHGGWFELWYDLSSQWHTHAGYTLDDPNDHDLTFGERKYNSAYFGNVFYDFTKQFTMGFEVQSWRTLYVDKRPGESIRVEVLATYGF